MGNISLYFVRHAPVTGQDGIAYGRDADIDETCHDKFNAAASLLPADCGLWITSEFPRAKKTARILQTAMNIKREPAIDAAFNEQDFGDLTGQNKHAIFRNPAYAAYIANMAKAAPPNGESAPQMVERVRAGLQKLGQHMEEMGESKAVIVCHGGVIRSAAAVSHDTAFDLHMKVPHLSVHPLSFPAFRL